MVSMKDNWVQRTKSLEQILKVAEYEIAENGSKGDGADMLEKYSRAVMRLADDIRRGVSSLQDETHLRHWAKSSRDWMIGDIKGNAKKGMLP